MPKWACSVLASSAWNWAVRVQSAQLGANPHLDHRREMRPVVGFCVADPRPQLGQANGMGFAASWFGPTSHVLGDARTRSE
jgi:hypothetical protein